VYLIAHLCTANVLLHSLRLILCLSDTQQLMYPNYPKWVFSNLFTSIHRCGVIIMVIITICSLSTVEKHQSIHKNFTVCAWWCVWIFHGSHECMNMDACSAFSSNSSVCVLTATHFYTLNSSYSYGIYNLVEIPVASVLYKLNSTMR